MKDKLKLRSTFTAQTKEQLRKAVTDKVEKIANAKLEKAS